MAQKLFKTNVDIARALGISRQSLHRHRTAYGWSKAPWTPAQMAAYRHQLEALRAVAPNGYGTGASTSSGGVADLTTRAKLKLLSERIKALEADNAERSGKLVPKELVAEGRMAVIKQFKGAWDYLESRAYELVGLDQVGIARVIHGWATEFYAAIHHDA